MTLLLQATCERCPWKGVTYSDTAMGRTAAWSEADKHAGDEHLSSNGRSKNSTTITRVTRTPKDSPSPPWAPTPPAREPS